MPPAVFRIRSSTSNTPVPNSNCAVSKERLVKNTAPVNRKKIPEYPKQQRKQDTQWYKANDIATNIFIPVFICNPVGRK